MNKKIIYAFAIVLFLNLSLVNAVTQQELSEAKSLIDSKISCDNLTNEQLEIIGEYYMEQMHPGEANELMDEMMGGEGSESLKTVHINMAKTIYCNENVSSYGMMGSSNFGYWNFLNILYLILLIGIIVLIILWIIKLTKQTGKRK